MTQNKTDANTLEALLAKGSGASVTEFHKAAGVSRSAAYRWISTLGIQTENGTISPSDLQDLAAIARGESTPSDLAKAKADQAQTENRSQAMASDAGQVQAAMMGAVGQQVIDAGMVMGQQLAPLFWQGVQAGLLTGQAATAQGFLSNLNQQSHGVAANVGAMVGAFTARSQGNVMEILAGVEPHALPPTPHQIKCATDNF